MKNADTTFSDMRVGFARRFEHIAQLRGIDLTNNPLCMPESGTVSEPSGSELTAAGQVITKQTLSIEPTDKITLIVPGLLGDSVRALVAPLVTSREKLTVNGYKLKVAWVSGRSGCDHNAETLRKHVLESAASSGQPVNIIGYSKGCADALHMLGNHKDTHQAVSSLVSYAGVVSGTPLADGIPSWVNSLLRYIPLPGVPFGDGLAINDLTQARRRQWLLDHPIPTNIRLASIVASPSEDQVSSILKPSYRKLSKLDLRNDSQVICQDAIIPNSELLAVVNADHWAIALPIAERNWWLVNLLVNKNAFPRDIVIQATIDHLSAPK